MPAWKSTLLYFSAQIPRKRDRLERAAETMAPQGARLPREAYLVKREEGWRIRNSEIVAAWSLSYVPFLTGPFSISGGFVWLLFFG